MEFRILGPLEVVDGSAPVDLGPAQQRALLALLLINVNRVVTTERILEELWGDNAVGKENTLWVYISRLRSALEPERTERGQSTVLVTRAHGYSLVVDPESVDSHVFEERAKAGDALVREDPDAASAVLSDALEIWRGSALEDFSYAEFAQLEISRLDSIRLDAIENRIEADLRRGLGGELVSELENLRAAHPTRENFAAQQMLALYQAGRQADALRSFASFRREIGDFGLEPSPELVRLEEQVLLHDPGLRIRLPVMGQMGRRSAVRNPFKGLRPFGEDDAKEFFGRDRLIAEVVSKIHAGERLLTLVGPSGSGKSSMLHAGLIPTLRKADSDAWGRWQIATMVPGSRPFAELEAALLGSSLDAPDSLSELMDHPQDGAWRAALRVLREDRRLLLVIDQFEELFTLTDRVERDRFFDNLIPIVEDPHRRVTVVLGLRAGFYDRTLDHAEFASRMGNGVVNVVAPTPDELEEAAQKPAEAVGALLAPSLMASLLADVLGRPGSLPLFQYTLTEMFDRRSDDLLTLDDYTQIEGLNGILTRKANDLYSQLSEIEQAAAQQLFLRLVTIADNDEWVRRRVPASEMVALDDDLVPLQTVIELFARHHLLTLDRDSATGAPTVEVAHEALLTEWDLLRDWIESGRDDITRHAALTAAMREWEASGGNRDYLPAGSRLDGYEQWMSTTVLEPTIDQRQFLTLAIQAREETDEEERRRTALIDQSSQKATRRLWALATTVVLLLGAGAALILIAIQPEPTSVAVIAPSIAPYQDSLVATGVARAERELPVEIDFRRRVANLEEEYRSLAEAGTDLIFIDPGNSGWGYVADVIADYPDTAFAVVDGVVPPAGAMSTYVADEGGGFVAGLAAGLVTESGVVGFVGWRQNQPSELWRAGFEAGVATAAPDAEVVATYIGDHPDAWQDVEGGRTAAAMLYESGADVVLAFAEEANLGVIEAAWDISQESGVHRWAIGSGSDWSAEVADRLKPHVLTSSFKRWDVAMFESIRRFTEGEFASGISILGPDEGAIGLAESDYLRDDLVQRVDEMSDRIFASSYEVPRMPSLELLPPPGMEVTDEIVVTWDGQGCVSSGDSEFASDAVLKVEFVNQGSTYRQFWNLHSNGGSFDVPVEVLVAPQSRHVGFMAPGRGTIELKCGPDLRSGEPINPTTAATISLR